MTKSTVPVGTGDTIEHLIGNVRPDLDFEVASNSEFLRAGRAVQDFLRPDRVVIGAQSDLAATGLMKLYCSVGVEQERILLTDRRFSELIKYAANGFLATKIAYRLPILQVASSRSCSIRMRVLSGRPHSGSGSCPAPVA